VGINTQTIASHRRAPEFVSALERGDRQKAQRVLMRILKDKDGQTAWELTQWYADMPSELEALRNALPAPPPEP
jgi:hypothetical protein